MRGQQIEKSICSIIFSKCAPDVEFHAHTRLNPFFLNFFFQDATSYKSIVFIDQPISSNDLSKYTHGKEWNL